MPQGFSNARIVLEDAVVHGAVLCDAEGRIADVVDEKTVLPATEDWDGDYLLPGFVDVHTDNLERQVQPRNTVRWPSRSAFLAHDAQCTAAGITTVADALCVGDTGSEAKRVRTLLDAVIDHERLLDEAALRVDHVLHLRCELSAPDMRGLFEILSGNRHVRMVSLMDHTPGTDQYADVDKFRYNRLREGHAPAEVERLIAEAQARAAEYSGPNRAWLCGCLRQMPVRAASHDDRSVEEIDRNVQDGIAIAEFPVTLEAARAAAGHRMEIVAGAPNVVRGGSHSGNVAVRELVEAGCVDVLASDYVPSALAEAAFALVGNGLASLPQAVRMISLHPARMLGFADRGAIRAGWQADLVRVRIRAGHPVIVSVWKAGVRVA